MIIQAAQCSLLASAVLSLAAACRLAIWAFKTFYLAPRNDARREVIVSFLAQEMGR